MTQSHFFFSFRAKSSRPRVVFLIYNPKSFLFHLEPRAHDLKSFFSSMTQSNLFPHRALSSRYRVVPFLWLRPRVPSLLSSCARTKSLVLFFWFFGIVHFVPFIIRIFTHIPYTRDLYWKGVYLYTLYFILLTHVLLSICLVLYSDSLVAHYYSCSLSVLSHLGDSGWGIYLTPLWLLTALFRLRPT